MSDNEVNEVAVKLTQLVDKIATGKDRLNESIQRLDTVNEQVEIDGKRLEERAEVVLEKIATVRKKLGIERRQVKVAIAQLRQKIEAAGNEMEREFATTQIGLLKFYERIELIAPKLREAMTQGEGSFHSLTQTVQQEILSESQEAIAEEVNGEVETHPSEIEARSCDLELFIDDIFPPVRDRISELSERVSAIAENMTEKGKILQESVEKTTRETVEEVSASQRQTIQKLFNSADRLKELTGRINAVIETKGDAVADTQNKMIEVTENTQDKLTATIAALENLKVSFGKNFKPL